MPTLPTNPELENRLREEAAKRGVDASDFVLQLIESFSAPSPEKTEQKQLKPLGELIDSGSAASGKR